MRPFYHHTAPHIFHPWEITQSDQNDDNLEDDDPLVIGLFGAQERAMFMQEILQQVVIGIARLDIGVQGNINPIDEQPNLGASDTGGINPYFPSISANFTPVSSSTFHPWTSSAPSRSMESAPLLSRDTAPIKDFSPGTEFPPNLPSTSRSPAGPDSAINLDW